MSKPDTLRRGLDLFPGEKDPAPGRSLDAMRADVRGKVRVGTPAPRTPAPRRLDAAT